MEDDLGKVVCGGTAPSMLAYSATYTDPHTQSVLSNRSVVLLSLAAEDTEHRIPMSDQCIGQICRGDIESFVSDTL